MKEREFQSESLKSKLKRKWKNNIERDVKEVVCKVSFTRSGFRPAGRLRLSPDKVVEHRKA